MHSATNKNKRKKITSNSDRKFSILFFVFRYKPNNNFPLFGGQTATSSAVFPSFFFSFWDFFLELENFTIFSTKIFDWEKITVFGIVVL